MSLWQLFANLKMRYGGSYDDAGEIAEDASKLNLDKIDVQPFPWRHLIAKTKHLVSCAGLVERILDGDEETIALSKVLQGRRIPVTSSKWQKHIDCLESWRVILMGWTWSPYVCQVLSWLLMLHEEPDDTPEDRIFDSSTLKADSPPSYLRFLGGEGFCDSVVRQFWSFHRKCRSDGESKDVDPP